MHNKIYLLNHSQADSAVPFSTFALLCRHQHHPSREFFIFPRWNSVPIQLLPIPPAFKCWGTLHFASSSHAAEQWQDVGERPPFLPYGSGWRSLSHRRLWLEGPRGALTSWSWQPARVFLALATSRSHFWLCQSHSALTACNTSQHISWPRQDQRDPTAWFWTQTI